jgi:hypothetical protein
MGKRTKLALRLGLVAVAAGLVFSLACGDDNDDKDSGASNGGTAKTYEVKAQDYAFNGLPKTVASGSKLEMTNASTRELHEMVVIHLPDSEKRPVGDLIKLPDEELGEIVSTEPAMVLVAMPGQDAMPVLGDGTLTEKGRYAVICFIPTGVDPEKYLEAAQNSEDGPPADLGGGEPHAFKGMYGEVTVN